MLQTGSSIKTSLPRKLSDAGITALSTFTLLAKVVFGNSHTHGREALGLQASYT